MRTSLAAAVLFLFATGVCAQERSTEGIVLMRVSGSMTVTLRDGSQRQLDDVQLRTGTGTIVSRLGHIVTNAHVVSSGEFKATVRNVPVTVALSVNRIEACFPPSRTDRSSPCVDASILGSDPELDLAVLTMSGNDFPYVPFGDSDAVRTGNAVSAAGYPLGDELDVGREPGSESLAPSVAGGQVSALRTDQQGNLRYLQTSAPLNPGNSGGPLVDRNGFAVGIVEAKVREAAAIGFAIPINVVKEFLARNGVESFLPSARLTLGYLFDSPEKLMRMQVPAGFEDAARSRLEVESGTSIQGVTLRIDRIASPWTVEQLENQFLQGGAFEPGGLTRSQSSRRDERFLRGDAYSHANGRSVRTLYAIVDLGDEKIVARYTGGAEQVAFNESVLSASLTSLEAAQMLGASTREARDEPWIPVPQPNIIPAVPAGWIVDAGAPQPCGDLPPPRESVVASPRHDFSVSFNVGQREAGLDPKPAAAQCARRHGSSTDDAYRYVFSRFGIQYTVEGRFQSSPSGVLQLEVMAPTRKFSAARELFSRWMIGISGAPK